MNPGKYIATAIDVGMVPKKNGDPRPFMLLRTEQNEEITWYGNLGSPKGDEFAVKAVCAAGFAGNDWDDFAKGMINMVPRSVSITVTEEEYNGKTTLKVQWVNPARELMDANVVKAKASNKALFAQHKGAAGKKDEVPF